MTKPISLDGLDGFTLVKAELEKTNANGNGVRVAYGQELWRAWRMVGSKPCNPSSGWYPTVEGAIKALDTLDEDDIIMPAR